MQNVYGIMRNGWHQLELLSFLVWGVVGAMGVEKVRGPLLDRWTIGDLESGGEPGDHVLVLKRCKIHFKRFLGFNPP